MRLCIRTADFNDIVVFFKTINHTLLKLFKKSSSLAKSSLFSSQKGDENNESDTWLAGEDYEKCTSSTLPLEASPALAT